MDEYKRCPDCAEMVRAQARKCRFCGYRFEGRQPTPTLLDWLRPRRSDMRLPELLAGWGTDLAEGEAIDFFGFCRLGEDDGYLLVTSARALFYGARGASVLLAWQLDAVRAVEPHERWGRRLVRVTGPDRTVTLSGFASRAVAGEVAERLRARPASSPG